MYFASETCNIPIRYRVFGPVRDLTDDDTYCHFKNKETYSAMGFSPGSDYWSPTEAGPINMAQNVQNKWSSELCITLQTYSGAFFTYYHMVYKNVFLIPPSLNI